MKLAWNAIVKNEEAVIERCIRSLLPYVDYAIVVDTGSEDRTPEKISRLFAGARKPFELHYAPFDNFSQARNVALQRARESPLEWDYLLLADADMELRVENPDWTKKLNGGPAYDMRQVGGALGYYNKRLVSRQATGNYAGVTHEYLDVPSSGVIAGADFVDHADGYNRPDKFARDIALLEQALATETSPGLIERYHFYLAQSYYDAGRFNDAITHYRRRVELGGYAEEQWYAQMRLAHCHRNLGDHVHFLWEMLRAYSMRPSRAEPIYELASYFRVRGENFTSLLFSEPGLGFSVPRGDLLFINDYVYKTGLREEFAICAYYDEHRRSRGAKETNKLALEGSVQARFNQFWYLQPLAAAVPSFQTKRIQFIPPDGYVDCNPSVINHAGKLLTLVRTVNYTITPEGQYRIRASDGSLAGDHPICTRNFIGSGPDDWREIGLPENFPEPKYQMVRGFEDSRLFQRGQELWTLSTVRELTPEGWCEQVLAPLDRSEGSGSCCYGDNWKQILPSHRVHQKNWMPWSMPWSDGGDELQFVYRLGTLVNSKGEVIVQHDFDFDVSHISGGSQVVKVDDRLWLALVHEARTIPDRSNRYYQHRFVVFLSDGRIERISPPFFFHDRQIEFAAGLAYFIENDEIVISYGVRDCQAWLATMELDEVLSFIYGEAL
jgi:glycosyltransferase involved in cell wall biosynthesis